MNSGIFVGQVRHCRVAPVEHAFSYRLFMMYLDLAELDQVFRGRWLWSTRRPALARFRREHHLGRPGSSLEASVRDLVQRETGHRPLGPIRLLTHLQYFGYCFNPVSFYYCFDGADQQVDAIVAEVNNTPWGERHCYVLDESGRPAADRRRVHRPEKAMHVSPFMPMEVDYAWRFSPPGQRLTVLMETALEGRKVFDASLDLRRREITGPALAGVLLRFPLMTLRVILGIHWQALRLWLKRCPVFDHPRHYAAPMEKGK
ncbi:MAG: DUF1365 family protein [Xanthomonadales bacterium]|nr:DUF1365 family protein [Xanthomonadales bacterium]NIN58855.1 DUF1365 family protein [Xanthomonadales bacterium]NIN74123.1 DUF1365 family protein [Xanthomonadales bacterium]NIO14656.1 DUF1365 family protein [Xanthomonadales bacterium]NIP11248.1 DUF1365 family protein [Xanthomonadales bacterium]